MIDYQTSGLQLCFRERDKVERLNLVGFDEVVGALALSSDGTELITAQSKSERGVQAVILPNTASRKIVEDALLRSGTHYDNETQRENHDD